MHTLPRFSATLLVVWLAQLAEPARADEALLVEGRRTSGVLTFTDKGHLAFTPKAKSDPLSWPAIQHVEFTCAATYSEMLSGVRRVQLPDDQSLTGQFLGWSKDGARLHPGGSEALLIPAPWIACVRHPPGWIPVFEDDFRNGLDAWKLKGKPTPTSTKQGLILRTEQAIEWTRSTPLETGKLGVDLTLGEKAGDGRWVIELEFHRESRARTVQFVLSIKDRRGRAETNLEDARDSSLPCKPGPHRALIEFAPNRGMITLDDAVLWNDGLRGFDGTLHAIRLTCAEGDAKDSTDVSIVFRGLSLARKVVEPRHPGGTSDLDEIWLPSGDQLFGRLVAMDRGSLEVETRERRTKLPWTEVLGFYPRLDTQPPRTLQGEWARVWLRTGTPNVYDELEGVVTRLDDKRLELRHSALGELALDRIRLHRLRRLFYGERFELDNAPHHLGDRDRVLATVVPARAEDVNLARTFRLDAVPNVARLIVTVVHLKGPGDGIGKALDRGELRTEVWINKERVDFLNRLVDRASPRPQRLTVAIPKKLLKTGENTIEFRQTPDADTGQYENCGLTRIAIETEP
jgi:hypothetical protein